MSVKLVFASNNAHKLEEIKLLLPDTIELLSLEDIGCHEDIAETGSTLPENASIKSRYVFNKYGLNCFGDDSGLEVDGLNGEPGVYSARYSGSRDFDKNIDLVLSKLGHNPNRSARFRTVISLVLNGEEHFFEGAIEGSIRMERAGSNGFGYDPIFEPLGYTVTFAEMNLTEKSAISHRAIAVAKLIDFLKSKSA